MITMPCIAEFLTIANDDAETRARLRSFRLAVRLCCGPRSQSLQDVLREAERRGAAELEERIDRLWSETPAKDRRRTISSWMMVLV
jgi:hypothetical protein